MARNEHGNVSTASVLNGIGAIFFAWVFIKGALIGYYDNELVPQIVVPAVIGLAFLGAAKFLDND